MTLRRLAAILYAIISFGVIAFQIALAAGAPWGAFAMGGAFPGQFPPALRIGALLQAVLLGALAAVVLVTLLLMNARTGGKVIEVLRFPLRPLPERIRQKAGEILDQLAVFQIAGWRFHTVFVLVTVMDTLVGGVVSYILAARTAHIAAPMSVFVWLCALVYILGRIPISMANLGVREVTLVGFLAVYGVEKSAAMLMSMILFSTIVFLAVIGAAYQLFWALAAKKASPPPRENSL